MLMPNLRINTGRLCGAFGVRQSPHVVRERNQMIRSATIVVAALTLLSASVGVASDAISLNPRYNHAMFAGRDRTIDPGGSIYGVKFGATEKQILDAFGVPNGVIAMSDTRKAFLYGKTHLFILRSGRLRELRVSDHIIHWELTKQMDGNPFFDRSDWVLNPGLRNGMDFEDVKKVLGRPTAVPSYQFTFDSKDASITLHFSSFSAGPGAKPEGFRLSGFSILSYGQ